MIDKKIQSLYDMDSKKIVRGGREKWLKISNMML